MSAFVSLQPCLSFSPPSVAPPHLHQLTSPTLHVSTPLCLLPCLLPHSLLHPYLHTLSLFCLYSPHSFILQLIVTSSPPPPSSYLMSCIDIAHFSTISASLLFSFIVFFSLSLSLSLSLSAWGSSSDIITPTVTMVSGGKGP